MKQRVTDEQICAELACGRDDNCSMCPFLGKDCNFLRCNDFDAYKDLQDARAQLAIAVKALEEIDNTGNGSHCSIIARDTLKEIQG